jgi:hypothetical protein
MPPQAVLDMDKIRKMGFRVVTIEDDFIPKEIGWIDRRSTGKPLRQQHALSEISMTDFKTLMTEKFVSRNFPPEGVACHRQCECCSFSTCEQAPADSLLRQEYESLAYNFSIGDFDPPQISLATKRAVEVLGNYSSVIICLISTLYLATQLFTMTFKAYNCVCVCVCT